MKPYSAALMLNLLSTTPEGVPVCSIGPWLLDSLCVRGTRFCDQISITALANYGPHRSRPRLEAYRQRCSQKWLSRVIHHHEEVLALQETCWVGATCPNSIIAQVWKNQSAYKMWPNWLRPDKKSVKPWILILTTEKSLWRVPDIWSTKVSCNTRAKATAKLVEVVDSPSFLERMRRWLMTFKVYPTHWLLGARALKYSSAFQASCNCFENF